MAKQQLDSGITLGDKLEELESLLQEENTQAGKLEHSHLPILDEVVTSADFESHIPVIEEAITSKGELRDLTERLEQKFVRELDQLLIVLKSNLKQRIMKELKEQLTKQKNAGAKADSSSHDAKV